MTKKIKIDPNPPRGERGNFFKMTLTLPPEMVGALRDLGLRRRVEGKKDTSLSALIREAVVDLLARESQG